MYYLVAYDISSPKRLRRMLNLCRRYLKWVQNSLFEGELTENQFEELKRNIFKITEPKEDSVIFYSLRDKILLKRQVYGVEKNDLTMFF